MKLRSFALFTALSLGTGCGGSAPLFVGSTATGSDFCHSMVDESVAAAARSYGGEDWRDYYTGADLCDQVGALLAAGTLTYDRASGADCLEAMSQLDRIYLRSIESCTNAIAGRLPAGSQCSNFALGFSDCAPGNYCANGGNICGGVCKPYVQPGGSCAYTDTDPFPNCAAGSTCQADLCVPDASEGQHCLGGSAGGCGEGLYCDAGTCNKRKTSGDCTYRPGCAAGYVCTGPANAMTCTKVKLPGQACTQGQLECYGLSFCGADGRCTRTGVAANQPCGTNARGEYIQCGTGLYCPVGTMGSITVGVVDPSTGTVGGVGTCQKKQLAGSFCGGFNDYACAGKSAYCDSATYRCATCDGSTTTGVTTATGGAGGSARGMGGAGGVSSTGGSVSPSAGGTAGSGNAGSGGSSSPSTAGTGGTLPLATACPTPKAPLIIDFTYAAVDAGVAAPTEATFGDFKTTFSGGTYIYPDSGSVPPPALTSDITGSNWHISGTVGTYSGFGLYWNACSLVDASAFRGISMTISGMIAAPNTLSMAVNTAEDTVSTAWYAQNSALTFTPTSGTCNPKNNQYDGTCAVPSKAIPVTATPTTVKLLWADFAGGKPQASVTPSKLTNISFYFSYSVASGPYPVDMTIDDLSFVP
jgi:hypothetical protein